MIHRITLWLCFLFSFQLSLWSSVAYAQAMRSTRAEGEGPQSSTGVIGKDKAISIASKDAAKRYGDLSRFAIVACEQTRFWRIIYDGGGPEYVIDKSTGLVIRRQKIPQKATHRSRILDRGESLQSISKEKAIEIAKEDARKSYGDKEDIDEYVVLACEQAKVWRVIFDYRANLSSGRPSDVFPNGSTPKYVIDKRTGEIIHKQRN